MAEEKLKEQETELPKETTDVVEEAESSQEATTQTDGAEEQAVDPAKELQDAKEEIASLRDRMLRMAADNENFKKRVERERIMGLKYAGETIFREMLPVVDNLERAISQGVVNGNEAEKKLAALVAGVELTLKSLKNTLEKFEVKALESVGKPFDPQKQEAMSMDSSDSIPANHVLLEFEKGYVYKDRLLRAAKVIVSSGPKA